MVALSVQDVERFTPERYMVDGEPVAGTPVYLIGVMNWRERGRWRAQLAGEGVRFPQDGEVIKAVRQAITELAPSNADELLAAVQAYDDLSAQPALVKTENENEEAAAARMEEAEARQTIAKAYEGIVDRLRQHPLVGNLVGLRTLFFELVPPLAAAYCLRGWENVSLKFERVNGVVPDAVLNKLPDDDLLAIGNRALTLQQVSAAQKGN